MKIAVIDCGSSKVGNIRSLIRTASYSDTVIPLEEANHNQYQKYNCLIISGGPHLFTNKNSSQPLIQCFEFIRWLKIPTLGICLGHQAIGLIHGSDVYRGPERREKDEIRLKHKNFLFNNIPSGTEFVEDHCEGVTLPDRFHLIASSDHYEVEVMASDHKPFFGVQFHPEISGKPGANLLNNFFSYAYNI